MPNLYGLILTGGSGTRLWPRSREDLPKQFLALHGARTLLQETVTRMAGVVPVGNLRAVTGAQWEGLVAAQAREVIPVPEGFIVREPCARSTAPAVLLGVEALRESGAGEDDIVIAAPSDHVVRDAGAFAAALRQAVAAAEEGYLATLGILPDRPETGFGYIRRGSAHGGWWEAARFVEKPDLATAEKYLTSGEYLWNSGVFIFSPKTLRAELAQAAPELAALTGRGSAFLREAFSGISPISFDNAVMEKARRVAVAPLDAGWSDVGSWDALYDITSHDAQGNAALGDGVMLRQCRGCFVDSRERLTVLSGVEDLIVVDTPDALLILRRGTSQDVREIARQVKRASKDA